jgi:UDP-2-acetamido-3-amino-2,3-dideoxy-glucuronate N-acetyltransferase
VAIYQPDLVNLHGCTVGPGTKLGAFVEIQKRASIGARCKFPAILLFVRASRSRMGVFVGNGVMVTNDIYPRAVTEEGALQSEADWKVVRTIIACYPSGRGSRLV